MTLAQYKRLVVVAILPMLTLGWWLADREIFLERHFLTHCYPYGESYSCSTTMTTYSYLDEYLFMNGGVLLSPFSRFEDGISADVITPPKRESGYENGERHERNIGGGERKRLVISSQRGAKYSEEGRCNLGSFKRSDTGSTEWSLFCPPTLIETFKFVSTVDAEKY